MKKEKEIKLHFLLAVAIIGVLLFSTQAGAFTASRFSYRLSGVIVQGGDVVGSGSYELPFVIGQKAVGAASSSSYKACFGIYCTDAFENLFKVNIRGRLTYSDGRSVGATDIKLAVRYELQEYEGWGTTDAIGNFDVDVRIPEALVGKNFDVNIYSIGEIDALYECVYDWTSEVCS